MQKKVFLQRGSRKPGGGRSPYIKYLLLAALGLMLLVLITPHLLNQKGRDTGRKGIPDKSATRKELPKPPEPAPGELPSSEKFPGGLAAIPEQTAPEPVKPPEPSAKPVEPVPPPTPEPVIPAPGLIPAPAPGKDPGQVPTPLPVPEQPVLPRESIQPPKPTEPPRDLFPRKGTPAPPQAPPQTQKAQPPARAGAKPPESATAPLQAVAKPPAGRSPSGKQMFGVQVGCFKDKHTAEEIRQRLQKKGYDVVICPSKANDGAYAYTVVTKPLPTMSKAATMAEQIKFEQKVSPTIIKMPPACELPARPAAAAASSVSIDKKQLKQPVHQTGAAIKKSTAAGTKSSTASTVKGTKPAVAKGAPPNRATATNQGETPPKNRTARQ